MCMEEIGGYIELDQYHLNNLSLEKSSIDYKIITGKLIEQAFIKLQNCISPPLSEGGIIIKEYARKVDRNGFTIAAIEDNEIVGVLAGYVNGEFGYITIFIIDDDHQGAGIGRNLYKIFEQKVRDNGLNSIKLEVRKENKKAISVYSHLGFEIVSEASETSYYMTKHLTKVL